MPIFSVRRYHEHRHRGKPFRCQALSLRAYGPGKRMSAERADGSYGSEICYALQGSAPGGKPEQSCNGAMNINAGHERSSNSGVIHQIQLSRGITLMPLLNVT